MSLQVTRKEASPQAAAPELRRYEWLSVVFLIVVWLCLFHKTIFLGKPVSRLFEMMCLDRFYQTGKVIPQESFGFDWAPLIIYTPHWAFVEPLVRSGVLPLWNNLVGCGYPEIGNFASTTNWLFFLLFPFHNTYAYNLGLVIQPLVSAVGAWIFARQLGIGWAGAFLAASSFGFGPRLLHDVELVRDCLVPFVFVIITYAAKRSSWITLTLAGGGLGLVAWFCHPEEFFCAIVFAVLLAAFQCLVSREVSAAQELIRLSRKLLIIGGVSFCVVAPLYLPLVDLIRQADFYKTAMESVRTPDLASLPASLLGLRGFVFLGCLTPSCIALAVAQTGRALAPVVVAACVAVIYVFRPPALTPLLDSRPICYVDPHYVLPVALLFLSVLGGFGLDRQFFGPGKSWRSITALVLLFPVLALTGVDRESALLVGGLAIVAAMAPWLKKLLPVGSKLASVMLPAAAVLLLAGNTISLACAARTVLRNFPAPNFHPATLPAVLRDDRFRAAAVGSEYLHPAALLFQRVADFRCAAPFYLDRYRDFADLTGAQWGYGYSWHLPSLIDGNKLDLARVRYLLSREPVVCADELSRRTSAADSVKVESAGIHTGARVLRAGFAVDKENRQIVGKVSWKLQEMYRQLGGVVAEYVLLDPRGGVLYRSPPQGFTWGAVHGPCLTEHSMALAVPETCASKVQVGVSLILRTAGTPLGSDSRLLPVHGNYSVLATVGEPAPADHSTKAETSSTYRLIAQTANGDRVYENQDMGPVAFAARNVSYVTKREEAINLLKSVKSVPTDWAVIEALPDDAFPEGDSFQAEHGGARQAFAQGAQAGMRERSRAVRPAAGDGQVDLKFVNPGLAVISCRSRDGFELVFAESYFPGWRATIDGRSTPIRHANLMFQSVTVPPGRHEVVFEFVPTSFTAGCWVFILGLSAVFAAGAAGLQRISLKLGLRGRIE